MEYSNESSLRSSLVVQFRVLHALLMREVITRFGRENLGVLWVVGEPLVFTLFVAALWTLTGQHRGAGISPISLAITGYSGVLLWRNPTSHAASGIVQNKGLLYHRNVRLLDVFIARIVVEMAGATASLAVLSSVFIYLGLMPLPVDVMGVAFGWLMLAWFGLGLALWTGGATAFSPVVEKIWIPTAYVLMPLSGAAFMVDWLPARMQPFALLLPMVHGMEIIREGWFGKAVHPHYEIGYMVRCCLVFSLSGVFLIRLAGRRVTP